ncbi:MAG: histidine phosphatase family protein [Candidatus Omnitrophica bacterium]|nr:histidine phosphatase family protein [Candidatus Omnitrophota bacterium]
MRSLYSLFWRKIIASILLCTFLASNGIAPIRSALAQERPFLPQPGTFVSLSPAFNSPLLKGIKIHPDDPFWVDFILDQGDALRGDEALRLIKYFLASITVPEKDLWVNLSPYEKDRIIPDAFGVTEMGRDLLSQDYILKQVAASLLYPEGETGKKFWAEVYRQAYAQYGTTDIPVDIFNKVWIVPEKAVVYESKDAAYVTESRLKVMLESDYLAEQNNRRGDVVPGPITDDHQMSEPPARLYVDIAKDIFRSVVIPVLEKEVNEGKNFAQLRQVYHSLILAIWFKDKIKESLLGKAYVDRNKIVGLSRSGDLAPEQIWQQYVKAFKKGAYNYIQDEYDPATREVVPKKYFSGGASLNLIRAHYGKTEDRSRLPQGAFESAMVVNVDFASVNMAMANTPDAEQEMILKELALDWDAKAQKLRYGKDFKPLQLRSKLIYVRHGDTVLIEKGKKDGQPRYQGNVDEDVNQLSLHGREQAVSLVPTLQALVAGDKKVRWFSSPLRRAQETAIPAKKALGFEFEALRDGLREISFGRNENLSNEEIATRYGENARQESLAYQENNPIIRAEGGEDMIHLLKRARQELLGLDQTLNGDTGVLFAHGTLGAAFKILLNGPDKKNPLAAIEWRIKSFMPPTATPFVLSQPKTDKNMALSDISAQVRSSALQLIRKNQKGHIGSTLSVLDILVGIYFGGGFYYDPGDLKNPMRDRFILSKGHGSLALYTVMAKAGFYNMDDVMSGHGTTFPVSPSAEETPGIEVTADGLGVGFGKAVGLAIAAKKDQRPGKIVVLLGDGESSVGSIQESAENAGKFNLDNLIVFIDKNNQGSDKMLSPPAHQNMHERWKAAGFYVIEVDGHDAVKIADILKALQKEQTQPTLIIANTIKGNGLPEIAGQVAAHSYNPAKQGVLVDSDIERLEQQSLMGRKGLQDWLEAFHEQMRLELQARNRGYAKPFVTSSIDGNFVIERSLAALPLITGALRPWYIWAGNRNPLFVAMSADVGRAVGMDGFQDKFGVFGRENPAGRYLDFSITEKSMLQTAEGLSRAGFLPVISMDEPFVPIVLADIMSMLRAHLPFIFVTTYAGLSSAEGRGTQEMTSSAIMRHQSNVVMVEPSTPLEAQVILSDIEKRYEAGERKAYYIRVSRQPVADIQGVSEKDILEGFYEVGKSHNPQAVIVSMGAVSKEAAEAKTLLQGQGVEIQMININNLDKVEKDSQKFLDLLTPGIPIFTLYDGTPRFLNDMIASLIITSSGTVRYGRIAGFGVEGFGSSGAWQDSLKKFGLNAENVAKEIKNEVEKNFAMLGNSGGIDLTHSQQNVKTENSNQGVVFHFDPAVIQRLEQASGLTPVILAIHPMTTTLPAFLGLNE